MTSSEVATLEFSLAVDDGWPPVPVECLPFQTRPDGYELLAPPLFVGGLSVGDVIRVSLEPQTLRVQSWSHVSKSGRTTVWLLRMRASDTIAPALAALRNVGCATASLETLGAYSVDVPAEVSMECVDRILVGLDAEAVATAFPSYRHGEPSGDSA